MSELLKVGDVIRANSSWDIANIDSSNRVWVVDRNPERASKKGARFFKDSSFVVEKTEMTGGGIATGNDVYPDGWQVTARRLMSDGRYDEKGQRIYFYQTGCFNSMIANPEVVRKMSLQFVVNTDRYAIKEADVTNFEVTDNTQDARLQKALVLAILALGKSVIAAGQMQAGANREPKSLVESRNLTEEATKMIADIDYPEGTED